MATQSIKDAFQNIMDTEYTGELAIKSEMLEAMNSLFDDAEEFVCPNTENWMTRKAEIGIFIFLIHNITQYKKFIKYNLPNLGELINSGFLCLSQQADGNRKMIHGWMQKDKFIVALTSLPPNLQMMVNFSYVVVNEEVKKYSGCNFTIKDEIKVEGLLPAKFIYSLQLGVYNKYFKKTLTDNYFPVTFAMETEENLEDIVLNMIYGEQTVDDGVVEDNYDYFHHVLKMIYTISSIPEPGFAQVAAEFEVNPENFQLQMQYANEHVCNQYTSGLMCANIEELDQLMAESGFTIGQGVMQPSIFNPLASAV